MTYDIPKSATSKMPALGKGTKCVKIRFRADSDETECEKEKAIWIG